METYGNFQITLRSSYLVAGLLCVAGMALGEAPAGEAPGGDAQVAKPSNEVHSQQANLDPLAEGNALYEKGEYTAAADAYRKVAQSSRATANRAFAWFNLGNCHVQNKAYHKAIVAYRRSIEESPTFTRGWTLLGDVYYSLGAVGDAFPCYRRVLEIDGPNFHAYQMLGELALKGGDVAEALQNFEAALKIDPDEAEIYMAMAEAHTRIRDYTSAIQVMDQALLILRSPPADAYFYLGQLQELNGDDRKAVRAYEDGLFIDPKRTDYYLRIAGLHEKHGDDFLSLLTLEQAMHAGIKKPDIRLKRGMIYFAQARYERALEEFQAAYALGSYQGRQGMQNVAAVYYNSGDRKRASVVMSQLQK